MLFLDSTQFKESHEHKVVAKKKVYSDCPKYASYLFRNLKCFFKVLNQK